MIGANIGKFLQDIAVLYEQKKAPEIIDISNQSSKEGIRIVIELKRIQTLRSSRISFTRKRVLRIPSA